MNNLNIISEIQHSSISKFYKEIWIRTNTKIPELSKLTDIVVAAITTDDSFICVEEYKNEVLMFNKKHEIEIRKLKLKKLNEK